MTTCMALLRGINLVRVLVRTPEELAALVAGNPSRGRLVQHMLVVGVSATMASAVATDG